MSGGFYAVTCLFACIIDAYKPLPVDTIGEGSPGRSSATQGHVSMQVASVTVSRLTESRRGKESGDMKDQGRGYY